MKCERQQSTIKMALCAELRSKLLDDDEPLRKRICLAHNVFVSQQLPVLRKEEVALECLCTMLSVNSSLETWKSLVLCLESPRMERLHSVDIQPAVKKMLINVLKTTLCSVSESEEIKNIALRCAVIILKDVCMEHYLSRKPKEFTQLCVSLLKFLADMEPSTSSIYMAKDIVNIIKAYQKRLPQESNFCVNFLNDLLMPLIVLNCKWKEDEKCQEQESLKQLSEDTLICLQAIAISKQHQEIYQSSLTYLLGYTSKIEHVIDPLLIHVNNCGMNYPPNTIPKLLGMTLDAFAQSFKKNPEVIVQMFVVLCYVIGLRPPALDKVKETVDANRLQEVLGTSFITVTELKKTQLRSLGSMLSVLAKEEINFDECSIGNVSGREWLVRLLTYILSSFPTYYASSVLHNLCPLASIDILLLENLLPDIISWLCVTFNPENPVIKSFHLLISEALRAAEKQQRIHKLIGRLLEGLKQGLDTSKNNINALITDDFLVEMQESCVNMHSKHVASLFATLLFHLKHSSIECLEKHLHEADAGDVVFLQIVSRMLSSVLVTSRGGQHTTSAPVLAKLCNQMDSLGTLLDRLAKVFLSLSENASILESLLRMCVAWGEVKLMLLHYVGPEACPTIQAPATPQSIENPFNMHTLHTYLTNKTWINLSNRVKRHESIMKLMVNLVAQKMRVCILFGLGDQEKLLPRMAQVLAAEGHPGPLQPKLGLLLPLLDKKERLGLAHRIASDLLSDGPWSQMFKKNEDHCDEKFIGDIARSLLFGIKEASFGVSSRVLEHLGKKTTPECLETMATSLCAELPSSTNATLNPELVLYLKALDMLPLRQLLKSVRCATVLGVIAACCDLKDSWELPARILVTVMGSTGKETPLPATMKYDLLVRWMLNSKGIEELAENPMMHSALVSSLLGNVGSVPETLAGGIELLKEALESKQTPLAVCVTNFLLPYLHMRAKMMEGKNCQLFSQYEKEVAQSVLACTLANKNNSLIPAFCTSLVVLRTDLPDLVMQGLGLLPDLVCEIIDTDSAGALEAVLLCALALPEAEREYLMAKLWPFLCLATDLTSIGHQCLQKLLACASPEQVDKIIQTLVDYEMELGYGLWKMLVQMYGEKAGTDQTWLRKLQNGVRVSLLNWNLTTKCLDKKILPCFDLLTTLTKSKVELEPTMLDLLLDSMCALELEVRTPDQGLIAVIRCAVTLLNSLLTSRGTLMLERIPVLQQRIALLNRTLARTANPLITPDLANQLAACAHSIEGIGVGIHLYKKDFARAAPYMVADVLNLFENYNIHHVVRTHLEKYLHSLLRLCDEHAEHFLLRALSPALQQLLRSQLEQCKKEKQMRV